MSRLPVESLITTLRGQKVILDSDLARLYGVQTKILNQAVKRNQDRFPEDFAFRLTKEEWGAPHLRSQIVTSRSHGGRRYPPFAFTEHGAIMAANVLNSPQAIEMSVFVVRAFVKMREYLAASREMEKRLAEIEKSLLTHDSSSKTNRIQRS
ncbi:MAG: ORF6N domain-containing protein [Nitrospinae bacterium]|nr:ORF6N domain-containing protein [Nitrospinota bacterium]